MTIWEYLLVDIGNVRSRADLDQTAGKLAILGKQGWEAVASVGDPAAGVVLFKRVAA